MDRFYKAFFLIVCSVLLGLAIIHFAESPEGEDAFDFDFSEIAQIVSGDPYEVDSRDGKKAIIALSLVGARTNGTDKTTTTITASRPLITDKEMELLKQFPNTKSLHLNCTNITEKGLQQVAELKKLDSLRLSDYSPTAKTVSFLNRLDCPLSLSLSGATSRDLKLTGQHSLLRYLTVNDSPKITDSELKYLFGLKNLGHVSFSNTQVTDDGIKSLLKRLPNLRRVSIETIRQRGD